MSRSTITLGLSQTMKDDRGRSFDYGFGVEMVDSKGNKTIIWHKARLRPLFATCSSVASSYPPRCHPPSPLSHLLLPPIYPPLTVEVVCHTKQRLNPLSAVACFGPFSVARSGLRMGPIQLSAEHPAPARPISGAQIPLSAAPVPYVVGNT